ncbi:hypothetical protein QL285_089556 [Trifolium repens]|nr:hypothetical protein QL285_089556 [Trifolium repens]
MAGDGNLNTKLPVLNGKNWNRWMIQMRVLFGAQDVLELVTDGYVPVAADATEEQKEAQRKERKRDQKALFFIHQCVDENVFEKIADSETAKAAWDTLVRCYGGDASVKKVKLQSLRKQYENLNMKNNEKVSEYISRMIVITNEMKACGETLSEQVIIEKVLRSLTPQFDYIVVAIEHSKDLETMRIEELQSSLEAHELRLTERTSEKEVEEALKASFVKKQNRRGDRFQKMETSTSDEKKYQRGKEKYDQKKNVQCYCCKNFGHYANDCPFNEERKSEEAKIARGDSDDEPVLLMAYESDDDEPVKLTFSDSEEVSEDDYEIGVRLYDSESESEVSEDESESEDDSEDEEVSEPESSEDESEDEGDSEGSDSESDSEEDSDPGKDTNFEGTFEPEGDSEEESGSEGESESVADSEGDSDSGGQDSGSQALLGRTSEGRTSDGASGSEGDSGSEGQGSDGASEVRSSEVQDQRLQRVRRSEVPRRLAESDMLQDAEVDSKGEVVQCAMLEDSEPVSTKEALKQKVWLKTTKEELETLISQVQNEVLEDAHCSIQKQLADALMKDVKAEYFIHLRDGISVAKGELAEYELRDGSGSNSYSEAVRRRNFCGHYSEAVLLRSSRASEVISQKQKKKQKLKLKHKKRSKQKEKQKQKLKLKEKQKARSKHKLLMRIQKSKSLFNFWSVSLCANIN